MGYVPGISRSSNTPKNSGNVYVLVYRHKTRSSRYNILVDSCPEPSLSYKFGINMIIALYMPNVSKTQ